MISNNLEAGAHYDGMNSAESEMLSENNESSFYQKQDSSDRGGAEPKRKLKKLRSIKLSRLPSQRSSTRRSKFRNDHLPVTLSEASPNYMKATNSSDARKESLQNSTTMSTRRSSLNPGKSLTRMSSLKYRRNLMSKSSGGTDLQRKVKRSRSIKKASSSTRSVESGYQASSQNSESSSSSNHHQNRKKLISDPKPKSVFSGNKSVRMMTRTPSLKPVKVLTKMGTFKSKKPSITKCSEICKATCSSTLKDSKIPGSLGLQPGKHESERASVTEVCPYSYCSLHGHHHNASPPLKRFVYMRRRLLKTQMSMKRESQFLKGKRSGNMKKGIQAKEMLHNSTRALSRVKEKAGRDFSANGNEVEYKMQSKNQKYIKAWHSIYKHALVGIGRKVENQIHLDGLDSEEQVENTNNCDPSEGLSESDHQKNELSQIDAVKLVQEAFDEILLQEFQDRSSDDQLPLAHYLALSTALSLVRLHHCMAANSKNRGVALSLGKRVVNQIWTSNSPVPALSSAFTLRRAAHTSVYDKNPDDHHISNVVPDHVIQPQSENYWEPHPKTGVFGPPADEASNAAGKPGFQPSTVDGADSVLEQKAWYRPTGLEDLEKPHAL